jgi:transcriptional regulator GlxA family with amidase domain
MSETDNRPVVGILLFDRVEVLDFAGPFEVLSQAKSDDGDNCLKVLTVAARAEVVCQGGLRVLVDTTIEACPALDALVIPGGPGADYRTEEQNVFLIPFIRRRAPETATVASVCTGAFILARTGLLDGFQATTHSSLIDAFRTEFPRVNTVTAKVVDQGPILTAAGVSSGIDLSLHLLERWFGPAVRARSARNLDGAWT